MIYPSLSFSVVGAFYEVHRSLGPGLLELPYRNALYYEFKALGIKALMEVGFSVHHRGEIVGEYFADLIVDNKIIIEVKSVQALAPIMSAQLINYLRISGLHAGYLVNFNGDKVLWKRVSV